MEETPEYPDGAGIQGIAFVELEPGAEFRAPLAVRGGSWAVEAGGMHPAVTFLA